MNNPYDVLGAEPNATEAQIKKAYKKAAKEIASLPEGIRQQKMYELDNAYDSIMASRINSNGYTAYTENYSNQNSGRYYENYSAFDDYTDVRNLIDSERIDDAEMVLNGVPVNDRNAEWHFLKGKINYKKGLLDSAAGEFEYAYRAEPSNDEYRNTYENIYSRRNGGYRAAGRRARGCSTCDICSGLICADCCCESMGGDLIPCC